MKIFFIMLITVACAYQSAVVSALDNKQEKQGSQQKMTQLKQLLARAMQSSPQGATNIGLNQESDAPGSQQAILPTPAANLISAPAAIGSNDSLIETNSASPAVPLTNPNNNPPKLDLYQEAFSNIINQMLPMSPEQIKKLHEVFNESQLAAATPPGIPPKPTSTSLLVNLSPQATPPVIRLGAGYITSLVFVDATGQPWPIAAYSIGDPAAFNIQWDRKGNTLLIQSSTFYKRSNLAVMLRDLNTPIMLTLISGQEAIDYRVDLRVPGIGPNAVFMQNGIPEAANPVLLDVLNGIAPKGSKELKVSGGDCKAWLLKNKLYLRTNLNVISPGWQAIMNSIDGTHAYQMQPAPVILALHNGRDKILTLTLEGLE